MDEMFGQFGAMLRHRCIEEAAEGCFFGVTRNSVYEARSSRHDTIVFDGNNKIQRTQATLTIRMGNTSNEPNNKGYLSLYYGPNILIIEGEDVKLDLLTEPTIPKAAEFIKKKPEHGGPLSPSTLIGIQCQDCFRLSNSATESYIVLNLKGNGGQPTLETKTLTASVIDDKDTLVLMSIYNTNHPMARDHDIKVDTAIYFPTKETNYYLRPRDSVSQDLEVISVPRAKKDDELSRDHLYFSEDYTNS